MSDSCCPPFHDGELQVHLGLKVPKIAPTLQAGNHTVHWEEGKAFIFDDSIIHQVTLLSAHILIQRLQVNFSGPPGGEPRLVLDLKFTHPDLNQQSSTELESGGEIEVPGGVYPVGGLSALSLHDGAPTQQLAANSIVEAVVSELDESHDGVHHFQMHCIYPFDYDRSPKFYETLWWRFTNEWHEFGFESADVANDALVQLLSHNNPEEISSVRATIEMFENRNNEQAHRHDPSEV